MYPSMLCHLASLLPARTWLRCYADVQVCQWVVLIGWGVVHDKPHGTTLQVDPMARVRTHHQCQWNKRNMGSNMHKITRP
jgi:hypothetical protein